jgi:hypothetical protein
MWGTAADLYRIGPQVLNEKDTIERFNRMAEETSDELWVMPYGHEIGKTDDHIHLDLGYISLVPREMSEDRSDLPQAVPPLRHRGAPARGPSHAGPRRRRPRPVPGPTTEG